MEKLLSKAVARSITKWQPQRRTVFDSLLTWVAKHRKETSIPIRYAMESTGVYYEQIAWYLFQKDFSVSVILPNKAKHYRIGGPTEKLGSQIQKWQDWRPRISPNGSRAKFGFVATFIEKYLWLTNAHQAASTASGTKKPVWESETCALKQSNQWWVYHQTVRPRRRTANWLNFMISKLTKSRKN